MTKILFALIFSMIFTISLTHLPLWPLSWQIWVGIATASAIGLGICVWLSLKKQKPSSRVPIDLQEIKQAFRAHLKVSVLFWSYYYKKERIKTLEEAKKDVFQDLRREFAQMPWMLSMLEEIRQDLTKYK